MVDTTEAFFGCWQAYHYFMFGAIQQVEFYDTYLANCAFEDMIAFASC